MLLFLIPLLLTIRSAEYINANKLSAITIASTKYIFSIYIKLNIVKNEAIVINISFFKFDSLFFKIIFFNFITQPADISSAPNNVPIT